MSDHTVQETKSSPTGLDGRSALSRSGKDNIAKRPGEQCSKYLQQIDKPRQFGEIQNEQKLCAVAITETWLNADIDSTRVTPPSFLCFRTDRAKATHVVEELLCSSTSAGPKQSFAYARDNM